MEQGKLITKLAQRLEELKNKEYSYIADELYSVEAMTNPIYREELEKMYIFDPLNPLTAQN